MPQSTTSQGTFLAETGRGLVVTGARVLNVLHGMALAWVVVLGVVVIGAPSDIGPEQLPAVEGLPADPSVSAVVMLADLPLEARLTSWVGTASLILAWSMSLWAAARVARQVATGDPFAPRVSGALRAAAACLVAAAVVLPVTWFISVRQVERWVEAAPVQEWGDLAMQTSTAPVGAVLGLLIGALATGILAAAFHAGERLRQETDGLV